MRVWLVMVVVLACLAAAAVGWSGMQVAMSTGGMEGMKEVFIQPHIVGDPAWQKAVGYSEQGIGAMVKQRVGRFPGLKIVPAQTPDTPRLMIQVIGHVIQGYSADDPPAVTHITVALAQPVVLKRRGPGGKPIAMNATTMTTTVLSSGKASSMRPRLHDKLLHMLDEMEQDYLRANPKAR